MKTSRTSGYFISFCLAAIVAATVICAPAIITGCKSPPPVSAVVGQSLDALGATTDAAMRAAAKLVVSGNINPQQWKQISDLHAKFRVSYNAAVASAAVALDQASVPADLAQLGSDLLALIQTFTK